VTAGTSTDWIDRIALHDGRREALLVQGVPVDYASLVSRAVETAERLGALGVESGDLVAVLAPPSAAGVALIHALLDRRIILLPLNGRLSERELRDALERTRARFLIVARGIDDRFFFG